MRADTARSLSRKVFGFEGVRLGGKQTRERANAPILVRELLSRTFSASSAGKNRIYEATRRTDTPTHKERHLSAFLAIKVRCKATSRTDNARILLDRRATFLIETLHYLAQRAVEAINVRVIIMI